MKYGFLIFALTALSHLAFATPSYQPKNVQFMFNVISHDSVVPSEADVKKAIEMKVKTKVGEVKCVASAELMVYSTVETFATANGNVVGVAVASLTSNCSDTAQIIIDRWKNNPLLETFSDLGIGIWPVVSGGN